MTDIRSELTAIARRKVSKPTERALAINLIKGRVLDYGCGRLVDARYLAEYGYAVSCYDKYYQPEMPEGKFDTILCIYVLNVVNQLEQAAIVNDMMTRLNKNGRIIVAVRRPVEIEHEAQKRHWQPYDGGYITGRNTYQIGVSKQRLDYLFSEYAGVLSEFGPGMYWYDRWW